MFTRIKDAYKSFTGTRIQSLQEESKAILDIFTSTQESLKEVNTKVQAEKELNTQKMAELQNNIWALDAISESNTKVIDKINKLLE